MKQLAGFFVPDGEKHLEMYFQQMGPGYQNQQRARALDYVAKWSRAVDIGAHVGLWSRPLVERFEQVVAFEPVNDFRECLRRNVTSDKLVILPTALGEASGSVAMGYGGDNTGECHVQAGQSGNTALCRLDDFQLGPIDFIKIDTEGYELSVLRGAEKTLRRWQPVVVLEQKRHATRYGHPRYGAVAFLKSIDARVLDRINDDFIMGWPQIAGKVAKAEPRPLVQRIGPAMKRHLKGDLDGAVLDYAAILHDDPNNAAVFHLLGLAHHQQQHHDLAISCLERATEIDAAYSPAHTSRGFILKGFGRYDEAAEAFQQAIKVDPSSAQAYVQLASLHRACGRNDLAKMAYQSAARLDPDASKLDPQHLRIDLEHEALVRAPAMCRYQTPAAHGALPKQV